MPYLINEGSFAFDYELDRSINIVTLPPENNQPPLNLVISRDAFEPGEDLQTCLARQLKTLSRQMQAFKELTREAAVLGSAENGYPGINLYTAFKQSGQQHYQAQCAAELPDKQLLVITLTSPVAFDDALRARWKTLLAGFVPVLPANNP